MSRSILNAGAWTALGLAIAFAVVSANASSRRAVTTAAPAKATTTSCPSTEACPCDTKPAVAAKKVAKRAPARPTRMVGAAGMVVAIDPESGELTAPTAAQIAELRGPVLAPSEPVQEIRFPNGAIGSTAACAEDYATVRIDANGRRVFGHGATASTVEPVKPALEEK